MPRPATGTLRRLTTGFEARIRIAPNMRKGFFLETCGEDEGAAQFRCDAMADIARRLRRAGHADQIPELLRMAAKAREGKPWEAILSAVDLLCSGRTGSLDAKDCPTFETFAKEWISGDLHKKHPDHVPAKDSDRDEELLRLYVHPHVGPVRLDQVTLDHAELVMANLPERLSAGSRRHVAQVFRRVLALAVYPARRLPASPVPRGWLPRVGKGKARSYIYPDEDAQLLACKDVPLPRRLLWGFLAREGTRGPSEALSFRWRHVDLERGTVRLDVNKTDDPRVWAMSPGVVRALVAWKKKTPGTAGDDDRIFVDEDGRFFNEDRMAEAFRADLQKAGVTRPELFESTASRQRIRAHDLRATFVSLALAMGKSETWVTDRTGHTTSGQLMNYRRSARTFAELELGELTPLDEAIPELSDLERPTGERSSVATSPRNPQSSKAKCTGEDLNLHALRRRNLNIPGDSEEDAAPAIARENTDTSSGDGTPVQVVGGRSGADDPVEAALAVSLEVAAKEQRWDVVSQLARELEARRLARASPNVVDLGSRSRGRR